MAVIQMNPRRHTSHGVAVGIIENVAGNPLASPVVYVSGAAVAFATLGNADGYLVDESDNLDMAYDVLMGTATSIDLRIEGSFLDRKNATTFALLGTNPWSPIDFPALDTANDRLDGASADRRITANRRRLIGFSTQFDLVRFLWRANAGGTTAQIALACRSARRNV